MVKVNEQEIKDFEWDKWNIDKNWKKHKVTNKEAEEVFLDEKNIVHIDAKHLLIEQRYMIWGKTFSKRKLSVFFTLRKDKVRIILARDMNRKERKEYEKKV